jgi:hypothetical protein
MALCSHKDGIEFVEIRATYPIRSFIKIRRAVPDFSQVVRNDEAKGAFLTKNFSQKY